MKPSKQFDVRRRTGTSRPARLPKRDGVRSPATSRRKSLKDRRKRSGTLALTLFLIVSAVLVGGVIYGIWREEVRIVAVHAPSAHAQSFSRIADDVLSGTYVSIIPRDSIFFFPVKELRARILDVHPEIVAVSIRRSSFTELSIEIVLRSTAFWWCGTPESAAAVDETCYKADAEGFIFEPLPVAALLGSTSTSSLPSGTTLRLYAPIEPTPENGASPLRSRMKDLEELPDVLLFVKELKTVNIVPVSLAVRGDEADLFVSSGTRLTYVIGEEESALSLLSATLPTLQLSDGSLVYVDLRFPGKVYLKRKGE